MPSQDEVRKQAEDEFYLACERAKNLLWEAANLLITKNVPDSRSARQVAEMLERIVFALPDRSRPGQRISISVTIGSP